MARILVVDDEELARFTIREILTGAGHEIDEAENGDEAIKRQKAEPFDLIVTDIIMPGKDVFETITELKQDDPAPIILAISAGGPTGDPDFLKRAESAGADDILAKPFSEEGLVQKVDECLRILPGES
ncbi:MAG: response regulator [Rhodospirillaceae bacterium]|jgi:CheY-like chemotaxis protein|nr:response regulator [Rhodospirillaceae bacterium]|tara:strand:- start:6854 stop:7237 length:384 start_codon:yes stop_codon:yes gene_type:complete